jgi:D-3-phosphoglycerate dehydrogenase
MPWTVLIPDRLEAPGKPELEVFGPDAKILTPQATSISEVDRGIWQRADSILAWHDLEYDAELFELLERCQILVRIGVGYDNVDLQAATEAGIPVCNVPDYGTNDVADHTLSLMLSLWRGVPYYNDRIRRSNDGWKWETDISMRRLTDARLAIIGLGRIGTAVARRAKAFGMDVVAYDPYVPDGYEKSLNIDRERELESTIENADIVTFHTPLTHETEQMADNTFFDHLRDDAVLVNTARGRIIDLDALYYELKSGGVRAAGLDVLEKEPPDPEHPLIEAWRQQSPWIRGRLVLTPHSAFYCDEAITEMRTKAALTAREYLENGTLRNCVNGDL